MADKWIRTAVVLLFVAHSVRAGVVHYDVIITAHCTACTLTGCSTVDSRDMNARIVLVACRWVSQRVESYSNRNCDIRFTTVAN